MGIAQSRGPFRFNDTKAFFEQKGAEGREGRKKLFLVLAFLRVLLPPSVQNSSHFCFLLLVAGNDRAACIRGQTDLRVFVEREEERGRECTQIRANEAKLKARRAAPFAALFCV